MTRCLLQIGNIDYINHFTTSPQQPKYTVIFDIIISKESDEENKKSLKREVVCWSATFLQWNIPEDEDSIKRLACWLVIEGFKSGNSFESVEIKPQYFIKRPEIPEDFVCQKGNTILVDIPKKKIGFDL